MTTSIQEENLLQAEKPSRSWRVRRWSLILAALKRRGAKSAGRIVNFPSAELARQHGRPCRKPVCQSQHADRVYLEKPGQNQRDSAPSTQPSECVGALASRLARSSLIVTVFLTFAACQVLPPPPKLSEKDILDAPEYVIAPLDTVQIFVWRAPDLSVTVPVRPDGRITIPLVEDLEAAGKSPTVLARDIEKALRPFVQDPKASVVVEGFANQTTQMVKVIGEVARPVTVHYQMHMSVLDVMAEAQGLTEYADGNDAKLIRKVDGGERTYQLKLNDLLDDGRMSANAKLRPGDLIVVPKSLL
ncbi:MAG: XrtA/PEP-CTERM system exopolysaccharide export protein [Geminicoccaceae bacterium]